MIPHLIHQHSLACLLSKNMNLLMEPLKNQFLDLFLRFCYFFLLILNLPFFCYLLHFYYSILFYFIFFLSSLLSLLISFSLPPSSLSLFISTTMTSPVSVSTAYHTSLDTSSFLSLLFSPVNFRIVASKP